MLWELLLRSSLPVRINFYFSILLFRLVSSHRLILPLGCHFSRLLHWLEISWLFLGEPRYLSLLDLFSLPPSVIPSCIQPKPFSAREASLTISHTYYQGGLLPGHMPKRLPKINLSAFKDVYFNITPELQNLNYWVIPEQTKYNHHQNIGTKIRIGALVVIHPN